MNKLELQNLISNCHSRGKKVALSFCSHVPQEILEAAGFYSIHISYVYDADDFSSQLLIRNVCPIVKNICNICEDPAFSDVDLIVAETSCDGKKKMYELLSNQKRVYFYQVSQGADRDYVKPLIKSEAEYLINEIKKRFDIDITDNSIRKAAELLNQERESILELMALQKATPPIAFGSEIYNALEEHRLLPNIEDRISANKATYQALLSRTSYAKKNPKRILVTGCPISSVYSKIINAIEENNAIIVAFENCEVLKSANRHFNSSCIDTLEAIADCYQNTACAIMSPNTLRFTMIEKIIRDYKVDGILDITLQTCHSYTVEKDKMMHLCEDHLGVPYMSIETDDSLTDVGQLSTRITAFIEIL